MRNAMKWTALVVSVPILLFSALTFLRMSIITRAAGGIPWSWDFVMLNPVTFALPVIGLALLTTSIMLFVRDAR
jgi:hypothetical protein